MNQWLDYRTERSFDFVRVDNRPFAPNARLVLSDGEKHLLAESACPSAGDAYDPDRAEAFIRLAQEAAALLLPATRSTIRRTLDNGFGAVLLENLPVDPELPPTPRTGGKLDPNYKKTSVSEFVAVALGAVMDAEIFTFRQEGRGSAPLFDNVVPVKSMRHQRGAGGYANNFPFHCESAWHRMRPDYVVLVGVREDRNARTLVASVTDVARAGLVAAMPVDAFRLKPPDLYLQLYREGMPLGTPMYNVRAPVEGSPADRININFNGTDCRGPAAVAGLAELEELIEASAVGCVLGPGRALMLNNERVCHTRTGYAPSFGPAARWFVRANFKRQLWSAGASVEYFTAEEVSSMRRQGWMDLADRLTGAFMDLVARPADLASLSHSDRLLADKAVHLTPAPGARIV